MKETSRAISQILDSLGTQSLIRERDVLGRYFSDNGLRHGTIPDAIVKPQSTKQVSDVIKIANKCEIPIVASSSGVHLGGYSLPLAGGLVLDMGGMSRILEVDERNRMVRFEPGVRYGTHQGILAKSRLMALNPLLPHREKSVLSSHLQREPMLIPKFEYGDDVLTMETVLPDGQIFRTGSAAAPGSPDDTMSDLVGPYGPGLDFFRLFLGAQGTLGIVTWMSTKIEYLPQIQKFFMVPFDDFSELVKPLYEIQRRMIGNECFILDRHNLALITSKSKAEVKLIEKKLHPWNLFICLAGGPRRPEEKIEYEERVIESIQKEFHLNFITASDHSTSIVEKLMRGPCPSGQTFWRHLERGGSYEMKFHATLDKLPQMLDIINSHSKDSEFGNQGHYVQVLERGRACYCETAFFYDPSSTAGLAEIETFVRAVAEELLLNGALFIEPDLVISDLVYDMNPTYSSALRRVKKLLDPNGIMNPGHLCF